MKLLPQDALLGITKAFAEDSRALKIDLGVGVFRDAENRTPVLKAVKTGERRLLEAQTTKTYTRPEGAPGFPEAIARLLLGENHGALRDARCAAVQTVGGCGALRLGAELLRRAEARAIHIGSPTWPNHHPLLSAAGHKIEMIPYYDATKRRIEFAAFLAAIKQLGPTDALLLHGPCHNPTGADLARDEIDAIIDCAERQGFLPIIDMAYHGFAGSLDEDAYMAREMARRAPEVVISYSCSKNFGLYRERTGALIVVGESAERANALRSHLLNLARGSYSMPPAHGGAIVAEILNSAELTKAWRDELAGMRNAIKESRRLLARTAAEMQMGDGLAYLERQNGMFSLLPLSDAQVAEMRAKHGVYLAGSGRINLCGVNARNVAQLCEGLRDVMGR
ncbi:MAG: aromatic amino acid transaminase [Parvularculaceae bacterium]